MLARAFGDEPLEAAVAPDDFERLVLVVELEALSAFVAVDAEADLPLVGDAIRAGVAAPADFALRFLILVLAAAANREHPAIPRIADHRGRPGRRCRHPHLQLRRQPLARHVLEQSD